jgi:ParB family chromosome partitioning protein
MSQRRSALGRGLGALIAKPGAGALAHATPAYVTPPGVAPGEPIAVDAPGGVLEIEVSRIDPNPDQPRREFEPGALAQLADSIRLHGVLQPVVVRQAGSRYELVMGERRFRASQLAGRRSVPAVVLDVQRQDLNPIELALAYQALAFAGHTQEEIGRKVSMDRSSVANHIRLLDLSRSIQADVEAGRLTMGHAKALLQVQDPEQRESLRSRILNESLTVRATEEAARGLIRGERNSGKAASASALAGSGARPAPSATGSATLDPDTRAYLERLERRLQTRVALHPAAGGGGKLEISYFNLEDLERIGNLLLGLH